MAFTATSFEGGIRIVEGNSESLYEASDLHITIAATDIYIRNEGGVTLHQGITTDSTPNTLSGFTALGIGKPSGSGANGAATQINVTTTPAELLPFDANRNGFVIANTSGNRTLYVLLDSSQNATASLYTYELAPGDTLESPAFAASSRVSGVANISTLDANITTF